MDGTKATCAVRQLPQAKVVVPQAVEEGVERLLALKANIVSALAPAHPDAIAVIRATKDCSVERIKNECMLQLAAKVLGVECILVSPQTVSAAEKRRLAAIADPATQAAIAGMTPKYLRRAALAAWCGLNA